MGKTRCRIWLFGQTGAFTIGKLALLLNLARLLKPKELGIAAMATAIAPSSYISRPGVSPARDQRQTFRDEHCVAGFPNGMALGVLCARAICLEADLISHFVAVDRLTTLLQIVSVVPLIAAFGQLLTGTPQRHLRFKELLALETQDLRL